MVRSIALAAAALGSCQDTRPVEPTAVARAPEPAPVAAPPADAGVPAVEIDACGPANYPVPTDAELHDTTRTQHGWFHGADREHPIEAACDLPDRVVMLEPTTPRGSLLIWDRGDGAATPYKIEWASSAMGHTRYTASEAPEGNQQFNVVTEGPPLRIMTAIGDEKTVACRFAGGGDAIADPLIACSTRKGFAKIDAPPAKPCASYPDGIGWPLTLTWWDKHGMRSVTGSLDSISADRAKWTYRFGKGKDTIELDLDAAGHSASVWFADGHRETCAMLYTDQRRS